MISIETSLGQFNERLARYMQLSKKLPSDILEKKGRDLGIKLFEGFREHQFGGVPKRKGIAAEELRERSESGRGIKVRDSILAKYRSERGKLNSELRSIGQRKRSARNRGTLDDWSNSIEERSVMRGVRSQLWHRAVGLELSARQSGIGVLAASFLWFRKRSSQARGTYIVPNRTGKTLGYVERTENEMRIVGETEGLSATDAKHQVVVGAINTATADMVEYITRKERELFNQAFSK